MDVKKHAKTAAKVGLAGAGAYWALVNPETVSALFGSAIQEKAIQFGAAFTFAAWIHSGRVKKEISSLGAGIITSVNAVADALKQDLQKQSERMDKIDNGFVKLTSRVEALEKGDK